MSYLMVHSDPSGGPRGTGGEERFLSMVRVSMINCRLTKRFDIESGPIVMFIVPSKVFFWAFITLGVAESVPSKMW